jgi:hypothetical protein
VAVNSANKGLNVEVPYFCHFMFLDDSDNTPDDLHNTKNPMQFANSIKEIFRNGIKSVLPTGQICQVVGSIKL